MTRNDFGRRDAAGRRRRRTGGRFLVIFENGSGRECEKRRFFVLLLRLRGRGRCLPHGCSWSRIAVERRNRRHGALMMMLLRRLLKMTRGRRRGGR